MSLVRFVHHANPTLRTHLNVARSMSIAAKALKFSRHGVPLDVLELVENTVEKPVDKQLLVKVLAAPINPVDVNIVQGKYPKRPPLPAIGGSECVGEIVSVGENVSKLRAGQRVVVLETASGTWATHNLFTERQLMPVSDKINAVEAATIIINPCTAYRMLKDYVPLAEGDCIIQNGANSAVGQAVHQLCKAWNIKSVGIVRDRPNIAELKQQLKNFGATEVLTEQEIRTSTIFKDGSLPKPRLALNCVGGNSATELSRHLTNKGVVVTYGGMSLEPVTISTAALIFKDFTYRGFRVNEFFEKYPYDSPEMEQMFEELYQRIADGTFTAPAHELISLEQFKDAANAFNLEGYTSKKYIFNLDT